MMIAITFADQRNSYDEIAKILKIPEANESKVPEKGLRSLKMVVGSDKTIYSGGELSNELLNLFGTRKISAVNNYDEKSKETVSIVACYLDAAVHGSMYRWRQHYPQARRNQEAEDRLRKLRLRH